MSRRVKWAVVPLLFLALAGGGAATVVVLQQQEPRTMAFEWPADLKLPEPPDPCATPVKGPFSPKTISMEHIGRDIPMIAMTRDGYNIPQPPPNDDPSTVAWDVPPGGIAPGSAEGKAILSAHTWPNNAALGNKMLAKTRPGDIWRLSDGKNNLCYKVVKQTHTPDNVIPPGFYARTGKHQIVFMVCSGTRLGPGHWSHRETWYATPVTSRS